jgi:undecaprenyl-diphosphatase
VNIGFEPETRLKKAMVGICTILFLFFFHGHINASPVLPHNAPDLFTRGDIHVESGRRIGRLLATGGTVTVSGVVEKGIVVVDGNLILTAGARSKGSVIVLGGYSEREPGAILDRMLLTLGPLNVPIADFVVYGLLLLGMASLAAVPTVIWTVAQITKKIPPSAWLCLKQRLALVERHWSARYIAVAVSAGSLLLTFFAEMAWETIFRHQMDFFDNLLIWLVQYLSTPKLDGLMIVISEYGFGTPFWTIITIALLLLLYYRRWLELAGFFVCLIGEALLNILLKNLFERSRPDLFQMVEAAGYSFPSGHAMVSLCLYGMIAFLVSRHIRGWQWRLAVVTLATALVAVIGLSRVYLGVHYPTDVVAGYFAGGMWLAFSISLLLWQEQRSCTKRASYCQE